MTDIFFSYSSADRERVRPIRDALVAQGFDVFWDQEVPTGLDWDSWIRQHLAKSKCAMAFWSTASIASRNVRHEATIADQQGKLIPVLLEPLTAQQFPMGFYAQQAANLADWNGDLGHDEWCKLRREYEAKLMPAWVRQRMDEKDAELVGERARREGAERRDRVLQAQIAKEAEVQQVLKRERDDALDEVAALKGTVEKFTQARADATAKQTDVQQALKREHDSALDEVAALKGTVEELTQARSDAEARVVDLSQRLSKVRQAKAKEIARSVGATLSRSQLRWQLLASGHTNSFGQPPSHSRRLRATRRRRLSNNGWPPSKRRSARGKRQQTLKQNSRLRRLNNSGCKKRYRVRQKQRPNFKQNYRLPKLSNSAKRKRQPTLTQNAN